MNNELIQQAVKENFGELVKLRRHLHRNPERAFKEFKTAEFIREYLKDLGIDYKEHITTGTSALIGTKSNNCVALRADIDALPVAEETGLECSSEIPGMMHACGHDLHTAMLMVAAKILKENESKLKGCVKLIFQPAEELIPGGAKLMIEDGVLEDPKPRAVFGQHIYPLEPAGKILTNGGPIMASSDELYWSVKGKGSHAGQPHFSKDPIIASANMILSLQTLISRRRNPLNPGVMSICSIHGGSATNVIPDQVDLMGTLRAYDNVWRMEAIESIREISEHSAKTFGAVAEFNPLLGFPPVVNDKKIASFVKDLANSLVGADKYEDLTPIMWGEDFAYFAEAIPSTFWFLGCRNPELSEMPPLHNPKLSPDETAMISGTAMLVGVAVNTLKQ